MRLFIAIDLPDEIKQKLALLIKGFTKYDLDAKWVQDKNLHLSLKFLGEVTEEKIAEIQKVIKEAADWSSCLEATLNNFGFFPNEKHPRVFFVATNREEELKHIAMKLEDALEKLGFAKENRFTSHITLARLKSTKNIEALKNELKKVSVQEKMPVKEIVLFKSTLKPTGPVYERIFSAAMKKG
ncbi:MAG: RNA 2',3'-cyclic phosphodiesterase [Candidatus Omnitrophota bacterium]